MNMKCTIILLMYSLSVLFCHAQTTESTGTNVLIHLPKSKGTVYQLLQLVTEKTGYHFVYDSNMIDNDLKQSIKEGKRTIGEAIHEITGNYQLQFSVKENYILITSPKCQKQVQPYIKGMLTDAESGLPIPFATIYIQGSSWGTTSNLDGKFMLNTPDTLLQSDITFSHIGYETKHISIPLLSGIEPIIQLHPRSIPLQEVVARIKHPATLLKGMIQNRRINYPTETTYLTTFYREGIQYKRKLLDLTEGILNIYKPSFDSKDPTEEAYLLGKNNITFRTNKDSLIAKISGGIKSCLNLDIIRYLPDFLLYGIPENEYNHLFSDITLLENRTNYVIRFEPDEKAKRHYYEGEFHLDTENLALIKAHFSIHPKFIKKMAHTLVKQQGKHVKLIPQKAEYTLSYKPWNGKYHINHVRGDLYFKTKKRKWLTSNNPLHIWFEMVTCHVDTTSINTNSKENRIKTHNTFMDIITKDNLQPWESFNIILRENNLNKAIETQEKELK